MKVISNTSVTEEISRNLTNIPFKPNLDTVPERVRVGPLSPDPSEVEEPDPSDSENNMSIASPPPVIQVNSPPEPQATSLSDTVTDMIIATPPPVKQAITLPQSDTSQSSQGSIYLYRYRV